MDKHPSPELLSDFLEGRLSRRRNRQVVLHLLTGCPVCTERKEMAEGVPSLGLLADAIPSRRALAFDYTKAFGAVAREVQARQQALAGEQAEAPERLREIAVQPFDRQWIMITDSPRFRTWAFCELLLDACREWGFQDPPRALQTARLGIEAADRLDRERYGEARVNDLRARAWATLANAERILTDFRASEKSFGRAERLLKEGTGEPLEKAFLLLFKASLFGLQQRFSEAFGMLDQVVRIAHRCGDLHLCGKALITRGFLAGMAQEPELSLELLREGLPLVDPECEPRLVVAACHNLILGLTESGRAQEARELLERSRPLYQSLGDRMNLVRLTWLEGKIALGCEELDRAEALFLETRGRLAERGLGYDTALLGLDLARLYARQGRGAEMRRLAEEMLPIFQSRAIGRDAVSALIVFQKAAALERVTLGIVQQLSDSLQESRSAPGLRFRDPW
jgi:tetratricopeptide (TPR) repeat protein